MLNKQVLNEQIAKGHYTRKQLLSSSRLISWSHRSRYETGFKLIGDLSGKRVLDFGCGDGTFLAMLMQREYKPQEAVGCERYPDLVQDCETRFSEVDGLRFVLQQQLQDDSHRSNYDVVICMEVLEHVIDPEAMLRLFSFLISDSGTLLVSVPVETGMPLLVKQAVRTIAGWRGIGDYPGNSPYTLKEYVRSIFPPEEQHIKRPVHQNTDGSFFHDHKGFNWRYMRKLISEYFWIDRIVSSPIMWLPAGMGTQVWFSARKRS